jgi:hypothetical protein
VVGERDAEVDRDSGRHACATRSDVLPSERRLEMPVWLIRRHHRCTSIQKVNLVYYRSIFAFVDGLCSLRHSGTSLYCVAPAGANATGITVSTASGSYASASDALQYSNAAGDLSAVTFAPSTPSTVPINVRLTSVVSATTGFGGGSNKRRIYCFCIKTVGVTFRISERIHRNVDDRHEFDHRELSRWRHCVALHHRHCRLLRRATSPTSHQRR